MCRIKTYDICNSGDTLRPQQQRRFIFNSVSKPRHGGSCTSFLNFFFVDRSEWKIWLLWLHCSVIILKHECCFIFRILIPFSPFVPWTEVTFRIVYWKLFTLSFFLSLPWPLRP